MKKSFLFIMAVVVMVACNQKGGGIFNDPYGQGGKNAVQYLKERTLSVASEIDKMEVTGVDTFLCDRSLVLNSVAFAKAGADFWEGKISKKEYQNIIDQLSQSHTDITNSWMYGIVTNDSLHKLSKYNNDWRVVYTIETTMKSTDTKRTRVMMERDGLKPYMTENEFTKEMDEWVSKIVEAQRDIYRR